MRKGVLVFGQQECAGNPVDDETRKKDIPRAIDVIKSVVHEKVPVVGVFVVPKDANKVGSLTT